MEVSVFQTPVKIHLHCSFIRSNVCFIETEDNRPRCSEYITSFIIIRLNLIDNASCVSRE